MCIHLEWALGRVAQEQRRLGGVKGTQEHRPLPAPGTWWRLSSLQDWLGWLSRLIAFQTCTLRSDLGGGAVDKVVDAQEQGLKFHPWHHMCQRHILVLSQEHAKWNP